MPLSFSCVIVCVNFLFSVFGQSVIKLNISQLVLVNKNTTNQVQFVAEVSIFGDIFTISDYLCKNYVIKNENILPHDETMVRCMTLLMQTLRSYRVARMKQIVADFINISLLEDGDLFAQR